MNPLFVVLAMIFCHIFADFNLQGKMGDWKQKSWWEKNAPDPKYKCDYLMILTLHSFSWAFATMFPLAVYFGFKISDYFVLFVLVNSVVHGIVDHLKANSLKINLIVDQVIHLLQIGVTAAFFLI